MTKFKVGDKVRVHKPKNTEGPLDWNPNMDRFNGKIYTIKKINTGSTNRWIQLENKYDSFNYHYMPKWLKLNKKLKYEIMKFIVTWDEDVDPHKLFLTKTQAIKFINEDLIKNSDVRNIKLYELGKGWEMKTVTTTELKPLK